MTKFYHYRGAAPGRDKQSPFGPAAAYGTSGGMGLGGGAGAGWNQGPAGELSVVRLGWGDIKK